jgi:hypothetical protein
MLIAAAMVALLLGYTQWRRQSIMREVHSLEADGFYMLWEHPHNRSDWKRLLPDWLWPVVPQHAAANYYILPNDRVRIEPNVFSGDEFTYFWSKATDRLRALGVEYIRCDVNGKVGNSYTSTRYGPHVE